MVVCVAGPIAAGKNYVCSILQERGYLCVDADSVIHEIIQEKQEEIIAEFSDEAARAKIALKKSDGSLDRRALGSLLFKDKNLLARQEKIVYPEFEARVQKLIDAENGGGGTCGSFGFADANGSQSPRGSERPESSAPSKDFGAAETRGDFGFANDNGSPGDFSKTKTRGLVINAALLFKTPNVLRQCQKIIYVSAPLFVRALRIRRRDKLPFAQIARRLASQKNLLREYKRFAKENGIEFVLVKNCGAKPKIVL